jgi:hypothetical protein
MDSKLPKIKVPTIKVQKVIKIKVPKSSSNNKVFDNYKILLDNFKNGIPFK